jgi:hypothetical protein
MANGLLPDPKQHFYDLIGRPLALGKVYTYAAGTTTPKATYQDLAGTIPNTNPITLDARGECVMYGDGRYRIILKDVLGITIWDRDNIEAAQSTVDGAISSLKADLANATDAAKGDALIGVRASFAGAASRTQHDKNADSISAADFGAVGDGVTDDTLKFSTFEAGTTGQVIDLLGKTYLVTAIPVGNKYTNGSFKVGDVVTLCSYVDAVRSLNGKLAIGDNALASLTDSYDIGTTGSVVALGRNALGATSQVKKAIAIGAYAQGESDISRDNIAIGEDALRFVSARTPDYDQNQLQGTRNIAIGGNAARFVGEGYNNVIIGRNAGSGVVDGAYMTIVGANAAAGYAPIGLSGIIENWTPNNGPDAVTAIGQKALGRTITGFNTAVGSAAAANLVTGRGNTIVGDSALTAAESASGFNGNQLTTLNISGSYSQSGNTLTLSFPGHGASGGDTVGFRLLDGASQTFQNDVAPAVVTSVIDANTITVTNPVSRTATGTASLYWRLNQTAANKAENNTVVGALAAGVMTWGNENTIVGYRALNDAVDSTNGIFGNVALGFRALSSWTAPKYMTALGRDALRFKTDGSLATGAGLNSAGVGASSRVSGDNQVQLGDSATTTYVYGTVQNRSDARDKADVRDTLLGLDFVNALRPVDYKWDMRDDYIITNDDGTVTKLPKDGSKTRKRFHHGLIAQDVQALIEKSGVDFGGFQNHAVDGGCDVLTIGYDELIAPLIKAVQELSAKVAGQEDIISGLVDRIATLESHA